MQRYKYMLSFFLEFHITTLRTPPPPPPPPTRPRCLLCFCCCRACSLYFRLMPSQFLHITSAIIKEQHPRPILRVPSSYMVQARPASSTFYVARKSKRNSKQNATIISDNIVSNQDITSICSSALILSYDASSLYNVLAAKFNKTNSLIK